jgi:hypothetical protein
MRRKLTGDNGRTNAASRKVQSRGPELTTDMNAFPPLRCYVCVNAKKIEDVIKIDKCS